MKVLRRLTLLVVVSLAGITLVALLLKESYAGFGKDVFVDIPKGSSAVTMGRLLAQDGVVRNRWLFVLARALRPRAKLQAGEYLFSKPASVWNVFDRMARGDVFYYALVVPEGATSFDIAASLDQLGVISRQDFLAAARDPSAIRDLAPDAPSLEGYLFPETYRIARHTTAAQLCRQMTDRFRQAWKAAGGSGHVNSTVTLASLVEKETARPEERPQIASVFQNRLKRDMTLDCDPTTIYAAMLENRYTGVIHKSNLDDKNPYNTYQHTGLPPGPIANAGADALGAALHPAETSYLYFVAKPDGSGGHQFSRTSEEHKLAVQRYRRGEKRAVETKSPGKVPRRDKSRNGNRS
jgi:UPF0755 protein